MDKRSKKTAKVASTPDEKFTNQDFDLFSALEAIDKKNYQWFDKLSEEQKRKFLPYMLMHWVSTVGGRSELSSYYLLSSNLHANLHLFNEVIQQHPELQWLMLCASSPGMGKQFHQWIPHLPSKMSQLKEAPTLKAIQDYFQKIYSTADKNLIKEYGKEFYSTQQHRYRLAQMYPELKQSDIEVLSQLVTVDDVDQYEAEAGN